MPTVPHFRYRWPWAGTLAASMTVWAELGHACASCVSLVHATALGPGFGHTLWLLLLPIALIGALAAIVHGQPPPP